MFAVPADTCVTSPLSPNGSGDVPLLPTVATAGAELANVARSVTGSTAIDAGACLVSVADAAIAAATENSAARFTVSVPSVGVEIESFTTYKISPLGARK